MKRSEMIDAIKGDLARMDLDFMHGRNLDKIPYHIRVEMITTYVLSLAERYGMLPPEYIVDYSPMMTTNAWEPEDD